MSIKGGTIAFYPIVKMKTQRPRKFHLGLCLYFMKTYLFLSLILGDVPTAGITFHVCEWDSKLPDSHCMAQYYLKIHKEAVGHCW